MQNALLSQASFIQHVHPHCSIYQHMSFFFTVEYYSVVCITFCLSKHQLMDILVVSAFFGYCEQFWYEHQFTSFRLNTCFEWNGIELLGNMLMSKALYLQGIQNQTLMHASIQIPATFSQFHNVTYTLYIFTFAYSVLPDQDALPPLFLSVLFAHTSIPKHSLKCCLFQSVKISPFCDFLQQCQVILFNSI